MQNKVAAVYSFVSMQYLTEQEALHRDCDVPAHPAETSSSASSKADCLALADALVVSVCSRPIISNSNGMR